MKIFALSFLAYLSPVWIEIMLERCFLLFWIFLGILFHGSGKNGIRNEFFFFFFILGLSLGVSNGPNPPGNPIEPTQPERFWAGLRIFGLGFGSYFRVESGVGSYKNSSLNPIFFFWKKPYSLRLPQASATSLSSPSLCKSNILLCVQTVNRAEILYGFLNWLSESIQLDLSSLCVCPLIGSWENCGRKKRT